MGLARGLGAKILGRQIDQIGVLGLIHHAHPAATELLDDAIVRDSLIDHARRKTAKAAVMLRALGGKVNAT